MIRNNAHKYPVSAMCKVLELPRSTYYYKPETADTEEEQQLETAIIEIFTNSRSNYGTRKIKVELRKKEIYVSRRRIGRVMKKYGLVSYYTVAQFKPSKSNPNESTARNELKRKFQQDEPYAVIVSDLTYVRVAGKWHYVCLFVDLFNREIIGFSSGPHKDALLVYRAVASLSVPLDRIQMFHSDPHSFIMDLILFIFLICTIIGVHLLKLRIIHDQTHRGYEENTAKARSSAFADLHLPRPFARTHFREVESGISQQRISMNKST